MIFDEFTNFLDNKTKKKILNNVYSTFHDRTILSVSHRISDLDQTDYIYYIEKGQIVEQGTPTEILNKGLKYKELTTIENAE